MMTEELRTLSLRVSEVFNDIAVNQRYVGRRRETQLTCESLLNIKRQSTEENIPCFVFGSQVEGTTTQGLDSDLDVLCCLGGHRVIQRWSDWQHEPDKMQLLMLKDNTTYPGHCLLQLVRCDVPLPMENIPNENWTADSSGRVLLRHSLCLLGEVRHGPAAAEQGLPGQVFDSVFALKCSTWPQEAQQWLHQQTVSGWPSADLRRSAAEHGCFVVPVASKAGMYPDLEWRISTAYAERCMMFSLNITQIRCNILLKLIIRTHIKPVCGDAVSSYICKTVLFHTIATSDVHEWNNMNLVQCFIQCIETLRKFIINGNCPHFIFSGNNLLNGRLSAELKPKVLDILCNLTENIESFFLNILTDDFGSSLRNKLCGAAVQNSGLLGYDLTDARVATKITLDLALKLCYELAGYYRDLGGASPDSTFVQYLRKCFHKHTVGSNTQKTACKLITPLFCSSLGCVRASADIQSFGTISPETFRWFSLGSHSDMSSSQLKLASVLYCAGELQRCEVILNDLDRQFRQKAFIALCEHQCLDTLYQSSPAFVRLCLESDNSMCVIQHNVAFCVRFLPHESNCVPVEMKYEMFRSTQEDMLYRGMYDFWMDWAVVDSQPYLYFLQYKMYSQLQRPAEQQTALANLDWTVDNAVNLSHKETALNLLGQCMEQENRIDMALKNYQMSLNMRARNNAAKWHICCLLAKHCQSKQR